MLSIKLVLPTFSNKYRKSSDFTVGSIGCSLKFFFYRIIRIRKRHKKLRISRFSTFSSQMKVFSPKLSLRNFDFDITADIALRCPLRNKRRTMSSENNYPFGPLFVRHAPLFL